MKKKYKKLPAELWNQCFGFTGTLPGVGKSYYRKYAIHQLKRLGYRVINTGFTHKATDEDGVTVAAKSFKEWNTHENKYKIHKETDGFYFIDEAFMMGKNQLNDLKKRYPKCCFMLFGDPLQFDPPDPAEKPLSNEDFDYVFEFNVPHRTQDYLLINFIQDIKDGNIKAVNKFINDRVGAATYEDLIISYNKKPQELNQNYGDFIGMFYITSRVLHYTDADGINKVRSFTEVMNNEIWKLVDKKDELFTFKSCSRNKELKILNNSDEFQHFSKSRIINAHKIQGDTFEDKIAICLDNPFTEQKTLYVAASRAKRAEQLKFVFTPNQKMMINWKPLVSPIIPDWKGDNDELIKMLLFDVNFAYILYSESLNKKVTSNKNSDKDLLVSCNKKNKPDLSVLVYPVRLQNKMVLKRLRNKADNELESLPKESLIKKNNSIFVPKNPCINHTQSTLTSFNNFVFEFDDLTEEEQLKLIEKHKKLIYRVIFSGNKSYHIWLRVNNAPQSIKEYEQLAKYLNNLLFEDKACQSCINPAQLMRAPGEINKETGKLQEIIFNKRNIIEVKLEEMNNYYTSISKEKESVSEPKIGNEVEYYFNICKGDHDKTNGGRGELILAKAFKQLNEKGWTSSQCRELIGLLCNEWGCPEKIKRLQSYF
jgi:hypothetical protein